MERFQNIFTIDDLADKVQDWVGNYYGIEDDMLDNYIPRGISDPSCNLKTHTNENDTYCPVVLETTLMKPKKSYPLVDTLTSDYFGLFSNESRDDGSLKDYIQSISAFSLTYNVKVDYDARSDFEDSCFDWTIKQIFDFTNRNLIKMTIKLQQTNCGGTNTFEAKPMFGVNIVMVFILSLVSLILTLNYFHSISKMYKAIRLKYIQHEEELKSKA